MTLLFFAASTLLSARSFAQEGTLTPRQLPVEAHKPMYFIWLLDDGVHGAEAKFQLSFKTRLGTVKRLPGTPASNLPLYFGYTQKSFWEISKKSAPFRESSYNPEVFAVYARENPDLGARFSLTLGAEHESNGMGGGDSRSWNRAYIQPSYERDLSGDYKGLIALKVWKGFRVEENNIDIRDYYGIFEATAGVAKKGWFRISATGRKGKKGGAIQADLMTNFDTVKLPFDFYFQYWQGEGESLINYKRHTTNWGVGMTLRR